MQTKDFSQHISDIASMLNAMERSDFDTAHNYKITLHGGISLFATNVDHHQLDSGDRLVTITAPTTAKTYERSTVLASEIQMITLIDAHGISPGAADDVHQNVALMVVDAILEPDGGYHEILGALRKFADEKIAERSPSFLAMVHTQLAEMKRGDPHAEFIPLLESLIKGEDNGEAVHAVLMMIAVDKAHHVSKEVYEPFVTEHQWRDLTLDLLHERAKVEFREE